MRVAMIGTRGVPARYGGFETAVEEVGSRLATSGHEVIVYCRGADRSPQHRGMRRVRLPALKHSSAETLTHTALSVVHVLQHRVDVALVFNAANAPLLPLLRAARIPVAVHVDGLEWQRGKWGPVGRKYYLVSERLCVALADCLIADAKAIQEYYRTRYQANSVFLPYGAPIVSAPNESSLSQLGLKPGSYHLVVARFEPENHIDLIIEGFRLSRAANPLIVVGSVPYRTDYERRVIRAADSDPRVRLLGAVWDQDQLDALYAGAASYLHGHSVGGTNPSLLRAMGAGASVIAWDVNFNREVLEGSGRFFSSSLQLASLIEDAELQPQLAARRGAAARSRAATTYRWDEVAEGYEQLCTALTTKRRKRFQLLQQN